MKVLKNAKRRCAIRFASLLILLPGMIAHQTMLYAQLPDSRPSEQSRLMLLDTLLLFESMRPAPIPVVAAHQLAPPNYTLSAGDVVFIGITSQTYTSYQLTITPEGKLIIPRVGEVLALHLTLPELRERVATMLSKTYRRAEVSVALLSLRTFEVEVLGETLYPTKVKVSAAERVSDAIAKSNVVLKTAS
ncbi:MAG: polysaccharide biosynthesis/export family protein, partial [Candidatus Thermochlorobacter sp.]